MLCAANEISHLASIKLRLLIAILYLISWNISLNLEITAVIFTEESTGTYRLLIYVHVNFIEKKQGN